MEELRQREGEIWGTTENPSKVITEVTIKSSSDSYPCAEYQEGKSLPRFEKNHPPYALFPFQGNMRKNIKPANCTADVTFDLELTYPAVISEEVEAAIWAWTSFGGVGARTRRGCGALYCKAFAPPDAGEIGYWYKSKLESFGINLPHVRPWPTIPGTIVICNTSSNPMGVWTKAIELMRIFRQGKSVGRNPGMGNRPGRSRWPEPETIRKVSGSRIGKHRRIAHIPDDAFPRAEFGLPIVFHFKDERGGDPPESQLYPKGSQRMSSPIIIRPLGIGDGRMAVPMIMQLSVNHLLKIQLELDEANIIHFGEDAIRHPKLAGYHDSPLKNRSTKGSALEGFMAFAKETKQGFQEVGL